ncbi:hypothetical protein [Evansella cellulosilytica]|uniref:Uncharacterized protein n=1 Tax=Evansella cellulosilytica (strain ATCC 21833 / DSM 2522 / FERM P-1141 / JCM 9156 / N-4) TaxID=649639 RepID=E6TQI8_EVAC2|nr:hypothetical protein [Evansella cellulosilytica]ADU30499.1 hypothetical protein Bcell_2239 [Evansella cellulosilytica DSM 2522]
MFSLRGDAHKFYLKLKKEVRKGRKISNLKEIQELKEIYKFYSPLDTLTLKNIHFRMTKEKTGSGLIPILVSTIPWILFIFSNQVQSFFENDDSYMWLLFVGIYILGVTFSVAVHFREKAWATVHMQMIEEVINENSKSQNTSLRSDD